jgi:hypothetical protein
MDHIAVTRLTSNAMAGGGVGQVGLRAVRIGASDGNSWAGYRKKQNVSVGFVGLMGCTHDAGGSIGASPNPPLPLSGSSRRRRQPHQPYVSPP